MKLEGDYLFEASVPEVWSALFDPVILAAVMPGCEKLELVDGQYVGEIKVKVGPIQGNFTGKVDLKDKVEPESYTMVVDGRGAPGFVKATARVKLIAEGSATRVHYDTDAQIGGKIASVGQRLIEASARAIVAQSLGGLHTNIKLRAAAYREAAGTAAVVAAEPTAGAAPVPAAEEAKPTEPELAQPAAAASLGPAPEPAFEPAASEAAFAGEATIRTPAPSEQIAEPTPAAGAPATATPPAPAAPPPAAPPPEPAASVARPAPAVAFTPVKVKQSDLANAVAKEVASSLFPRSVLVAIILIQALVIVWLLLRH